MKFKPTISHTVYSTATQSTPFFTLIMQKRLKYIITFTIFLILAFVFYFWNPYNIASNYFGVSTIVILFVGVFLIGLMINYTLIFSTKEQMRENNTVWDTAVKTIIILASLCVSGGLLYWIIMSAGSLYSSSSIVSFIINLCLLIVIFGLIYKVLITNPYIQSSPYIRFIVNFILYIPCIFVSVIDTLVIIFYRQKMNNIEIGNKTEFILLGIGILMLVLYFILPYLENYVVLQGGTQLINEPVYTNNFNNLSSYILLNNINPKTIPIIYDYDYGISFWLYLDSIPTNEDKYMTVFNYGDKPRVLYKSSTNTMIITEKPNETLNALTNSIIIPTKTTPSNKKTTSNKPSTKTTKKTHSTNIPTTTTIDVDDKGNRIIYTRDKILIQKWNNIIMNYNGGTLDIFYNGELVKSEPNVVPYMTMDNLSIGENNGMNGGICNLVYFRKTLTQNQIYYLYNSVKNKTPPTLYNY